MKKVPIRRSTSWLLAGLAAVGLALAALLAIPIVAAAGHGAGDPSSHPRLSIATCEARSGGEHPHFDRFLDELVSDQVISGEQADLITERLAGKHFNTCVARILFECGTAIDATADVTQTEPRAVLGGLIAGQSLTEYAGQHAVDEATLVAAIMTAPRERAAGLVSAGELSQDVADDILDSLEARVTDLIQVADVKPRHFRQLRQFLTG